MLISVHRCFARRHRP